MIKGIGIDIIEIDRVKKILEKQPRFIERVLTEKESERFQMLTGHRQVEFLAGRFAAKEAYAKAIGSGIGKDLSFLDIEILANEQGKPFIKIINKKDLQIHLSISHSREYAVAQVVLERLEDR